jgi:peroxiredoxin
MSMWRIAAASLSAVLVLAFVRPALGDVGIAAKLDDIEPLQIGAAAPTFTVYRENGSGWTFNPSRLQRPALIIFYRGGWCGACNEQLRDMATVIEDIRDLDVDVIFPNGDRPEILYTSLAPETKLAIEGLDYSLFSDVDLNAASAFGVAYVLDDETLARYRSREHWDLEDSSIDRHDALPLPSIFLVTTDGKIAFTFHNPNTRIRLSSADLLQAVRDKR